MKSLNIKRIKNKNVYSSINAQGIKSNGFIFVTRTGKNVKGSYGKGLTEQAKMIMENIKTILEENESSLDNIVKVTIYITDLDKVGEFNEVYYSYFKDKDIRPVRCCVEVSKLAAEAEVEVEFVAVY
ncbi:MAG: RidA family protein [Actinobacteria bacterium]|nr:RidA family protein [Actinomycetota bacterium]